MHNLSKWHDFQKAAVVGRFIINAAPALKVLLWERFLIIVYNCKNILATMGLKKPRGMYKKLGSIEKW